jgi:signal peptidase I
VDRHLLKHSEQAFPPVSPSPSTTSNVTTTGTTTVRPTWAGTLLKDLLETVLPAIFIAIFMVMFVIQPTRVDGVSMEPTLHSAQRLVIEKVSYRFNEPAHGDVLVLKLTDRENLPIIKRVIGTAGDVVAIRNGVVYLNELPLDEPYISEMTPGDLPSTVVPEGYLFVLGDNRNESNDSRTFGVVPIESVVGRALLSYWPTNTIGIVR